MIGLEPTRVAPAEPKSAASASFVTSACSRRRSPRRRWCRCQRGRSDRRRRRRRRRSLDVDALVLARQHAALVDDADRQGLRPGARVDRHLEGEHDRRRAVRGPVELAVFRRRLLRTRRGLSDDVAVLRELRERGARVPPSGRAATERGDENRNDNSAECQSVHVRLPSRVSAVLNRV